MLKVEVGGSVREVDARAWDALVGDGSPFLEHAWLVALEETGCVGPGTGWSPRLVRVRDEAGRLVGAAPAWLKTDSFGEFVYDHAWAAGATRAGLRYYPKVVVAVPFTPVTGRRLLVRSDADAPTVEGALLAGLQEASRQAYGLHVLFPPEGEAQTLERAGLFLRLQTQSHWTNRGYSAFDDFLSIFRSKLRKQIKRERREALGSVQVEVVERPSPEILDHLYGFYLNTCQRHGPWGRAYLNRAFFEQVGHTFGHRLLAVIARREGRVVAGAFDVVKGDRLYGRMWGCLEEIPFLHFEVCYYAGIELAIQRRLSVFEPGHGGEHKDRRGFEPTLTWSAHHLRDPRLNAACEAFAKEEAAWVREQLRPAGDDGAGPVD
jgi:hypothetical protein